MEGFIVWAGKDRDNAMFHLFEKPGPALVEFYRWLQPDMPKVEMVGIAETEITKCRFGHLDLPEMGGCIRCEDLRFDAMMERAEMKRMEAEENGEDPDEKDETFFD